jgi:CDP-6-deoxy-D-xylo-4-hexulose-3-dehydrase
MLSLRAHGWTRNLDNHSTIYNKNEDEFYESFNFILPGYNLRPLEFEGAIGLEQLKKIPRIINQRKSNALYFQKKMEKFTNYSTQKEIGLSSWFGFSIILINDLEGKRSRLIELLRGKGVEVRPIVAGNFVLNPVIKYLNHRVYGNLKNATYIHQNGFFVGNHSVTNERQIDLLVRILEEFDN